MKTMKLFKSGLVAGGIALSMVTTLAAQSAQEGVAKVIRIHGSARYMTSENATWQPLKSGALLKPGAIIQTAADSYVDVILNNPTATASLTPMSASSGGGPPPLMNASHVKHPKVEQDAVRIFENTVLGFDKLNVTQTGADKVTETELNLQHGRIFGTVKKLNAGSSYKVKIPNGVAGIRGTVYLLSSDGELSVLSSLSDLMNNVPSGSVVLAYVGADGNVITQVVADGQQFNTHTGQLTPIPDSIMQSMLDWAGALGFAPGGRFIEFAHDRTVYLLSATVAQSSRSVQTAAR